MSALDVVWRGRYIVAVCLFLAVVVGYVKGRMAVPAFRAQSKLLLQQSMPNVLGDVISGSGQSSGYLYTQCEIIQSTALLTKALTEPGVADAACLRGVKDPVTFLKNTVIALADPNGDLIHVEMDCADPVGAAAIVNGIDSAYITYLSEQHQSTALVVLKILQKQAQEGELEHTREQQNLTDFRKANPELALAADHGNGLQIPFSAELAEAHVHAFDLKGALDEASHFTNDPEYLKRILDRSNSKTGMPPINDPVFDTSLAQQCTAIEHELVDIPAMNPTAIHDKEKLKVLRREIDLERTESAEKFMSLLDQQYQAAVQNEQALEARVKAERSKLIDINSKEAEYDQLVNQEQNTSRQLDMLYGRMKTVNVNEEVGGLTASVLEPAVPSFESIGTGRTKIMSMALVVGLMVGLGGSVLREMIDQRFRSIEEISRMLSLPILGAVPHILPGEGWFMPMSFGDFRANWRKYLRIGLELASPSQWRSAQNLIECGQAMHLQPRSDVAEAYRTIRTAIYFGLSGAPAKTILITSPSSGDGKTTLASNLAIAIAQAGRRVLLIDADCWRPAQHEIFGLTEENGLTSVLTQKIKLADAVRKTDVDKLDVLPCGELPSNPAELLESQALLDLLSEASEQYDQILLDSPPVVPITDARILAASCGATILVLRAGKSTRNEADDAFEALSAVGAPVLGVVVNDAIRQSHKKSYQYYRYTAERTERWNQFETNGNGNGHTHSNGNGNGHSKHLTGPVVEIEDVIESKRA